MAQKITVVLEFSADNPIDLSATLEKLEVSAIKAALVESKGIKSHAAKMLSILRTTFIFKLKRFDINSPLKGRR